ncbi:polyprenol phosphomannose-dependent alpha 1,6 mannosyltransferase MptB [Salinifilum ghardaiensis]
MASGETSGEPTLDRNPEQRVGRAEREREPEELSAREQRRCDVVRRFGTAGSMVLAAGAIGAGANPVHNPITGVRVLGLFPRIPTVSMACAWLGVFMLVAAWLWLGTLARPGRGRIMSMARTGRTLVMWALPLAVAPPLFSTDMYSYLAQSEVAARGFDPYVLGSDTALGIEHPFTANVPNIWRDTPSPYGPLFLMLGQLISRVIGDNVVLGVLVWRLVMLLGLAAAIWAVPHLARRCGVHPVPAMWLGALNPVVLLHVVSGMHNDILMVGIALAAFELGLRWNNWPGTIAVGVLLTLGGAIKLPGFVALGFFGMALVVRRRGGFGELLRVGAVLLAVFLATMTLITLASGWGLGWLETLDVPNRVKSFLAPLTAFGMTGAGAGMLLGLGNHTEAMLEITKYFGYTIAGVVCLVMLWLTFRRRTTPLVGLGVTWLVLALSAPVLWPWYLLWAIVPLALATNDRRFRITAVAICAAVSLFIPPTGAGFVLRAYQVPLAVVAALLVFGALTWFLRHRLPWPAPLRGRFGLPE